MEKMKLAKGKYDFLKFRQGIKLTRKQSINAYCYDCMGFYLDSKKGSCENNSCPLFYYMPYNLKVKK